ncbi:27122_t:CDS:2 [Gigaspora margarita]|uniref:27122_t:CDS:1 n=1 Tax=Gigaspora margarita TaxID=4874 RepID=A0ABN7USB1_GIGMA|nr:27122_t:CDS:2 [Gigaspora margarita]
MYENNKTNLERYYNTIQKTYNILKEAFVDKEIDIMKLAELCNEIKEICGNEDFGDRSNEFASGSTTSNFKEMDEDFNKASNDFARSTISNNEGTNNRMGREFPTLTRTHRFVETNQDFDTEKLIFR